jgi:hypothetical protein
MSINENGCSICKNGEEKFEFFNSYLKQKKMLQYDYRTEDGELFSTVASTLERARNKRDKWLENGRK